MRIASASAEQEQIIGAVLAHLAVQAGGIVEVSAAEVLAVAEKYGDPAALLIGKDDKGAFIACLTPDELSTGISSWEPPRPAPARA